MNYVLLNLREFLALLRAFPPFIFIFIENKENSTDEKRIYERQYSFTEAFLKTEPTHRFFILFFCVPVPKTDLSIFNFKNKSLLACITTLKGY